jgi:hypothetical protein
VREREREKEREREREKGRWRNKRDRRKINAGSLCIDKKERDLYFIATKKNDFS